MDNWRTEMPVCPYCGHQAKCIADLVTQEGIEKGDGATVCGECGEEYAVTMEVVHLFTTRKRDG